MKIKYKVNLLIVILKVIMALLVVVSVNLVVGQVLEEEMRDKDVAITELLASEIANPLLGEDDLRVQEIIDDLKRKNTEVRYAYVVGFDGTVVAHTFKDGFPVELVTANQIPSGEDGAIQILSAEGESIQDVGVRVLEGMDAKIYIGFSRAHLFEAIKRTTNTILIIAALVLLFGILLNSFLMQRMLKPIEALVEGTKRVGDGDFDFRIDVTSRDEIGTLTESFNSMTAERKQAEEVLRGSEERYRLLADNTLDVIWKLDFNLKFTYSNPAVFDMLGFTPEEWMGTRLPEHCSPEEMQKIQRLITQEIENPKKHTGVVFETSFFTKNGEEIPCEINARILFDENGRPTELQGSTRDITERKQAEEVLLESKERYRLLADNTLDVIWKLDLNLEFTYSNPAIFDMLGFTPEEWIGTRLPEHCSPEEMQKMQRLMTHEIENQKKHTGVVFESIFFNKNGEGIPCEVNARILFDENGRPISMQGTTRDITERKAAEVHIKHLNSVLEAIRNVNQLILVEKDRDTLLQEACDALVKARGYDVAWLGFSEDGETFAMVKGSGFPEDVSRFCEYMMSGDYPPCIRDALARKDQLAVMDKSEECGDCFFESVCRGKEAAIIQVEHSGRFFGLLAVLLAPDVSIDEEEKGILAEVAGDIAFALHNMELEEVRKNAEDQIKASLKEKEVLLREIHHRVKNNLQVISSLLDMQARNAKDKDVKDALSESMNRIMAMSLIHSQLYEGSDLSEINMKMFVNRLLGQLQSYQVGDTRIAHVIQVDDYPFPIAVAVPVGLVINELLSNALKHAFAGRDEGRIEVILTASESGMINLRVSDDGVGLPPGFDINKSKTLGLRLVKIITEDQLRGTLEVTGEEGATFNIEFDITDY
jgi:PAS domain S-box-containing protein